MNRKRLFWGIGGIAVVALVIILFNAKNGSGDEPAVQTEKVERSRIVQTVSATGRIQPKTQVKISADISAKITRLGVKEGDWVEKGQLLVELDQERFRAAVESAAASLRSTESEALLAKENMLKAKKDYERVEELFEKNLESQASVDQFYAAYHVEMARHQSALDRVEQVRATLRQAKDDLSKTTIVSPMDGTISQLNKENGEIALGSQFQEDVIMLVSNLSGMEALVNVDENDIIHVSVADSATIEVDALPDLILHGLVTEIANSASITGQSTAEQKTEFEVKIAITDAVPELRPGMTTSSDIVTEVKEDVLTVPIQCVALRTPEQLVPEASAESGDAIADETETRYKTDNDGFVQVVFVIEDGKSIARQVKTGIQSDTHIEIFEGLQEGDVVVTGSYRAISKDLRNDQEVAIDNDTKPLPK